MDRYDFICNDNGVTLLPAHSGLMMLQTTNAIFNQSIYSQVTYKSLLAWQRVRLANWLASSGKEWAYYVSQYNSGKHHTIHY